MVIRVAVVTLFLGSFLFLGIRFKEGPFLIPAFYSLIAATYFFTLISAILYKLISHRASAYIQIFSDIILVTALVSATDGVESPFVFLYLFSIIPASIMLYRRGALSAAAAASIFYGMVVDVQYYNLFPFIAGTMLPVKTLFYVLSLHIAAFFAVAYLGSSAVETLRRMKDELRAKDSNIEELQAFNVNVAQCMSTGLLTTDEQGRITAFNRAAEEITGLKWDDVRGKGFPEILPVKEIEEILSSAKQILPIYRFESEISRRDESRIILGMNVSHLLDDGGRSHGLIVIFQDLTKVKEMEKEVKKREKMAMIGEVAAGMAHEIRNPLASLSGSMQILKEELSLQGDNAYLMEIALREMDRLNMTITEFLTYAKPNPPQKKIMDVNDLLLDTINLLQNSDLYRSADIHTQKEFKEESLMLSVDPHQMSQVFWNLSMNAIQAMPDGGVLTISSRISGVKGADPVSKSGEWAEIVFKDTGQGIQEGILEKIFVPFYTTKENGSGLGLSIVHRIIEEHEGRIYVKSKPGKGTQFTIYLPVE